MKIIPRHHFHFTAFGRLLGVSVLLVSGTSARLYAAGVKKPAAKTPVVQSKAPHQKVAPAKPVRPKDPWAESGSGLVVGEPVWAGTGSPDSGLTEFGAACSRWLQFHVGGRGELGKTPTWAQIDLARAEMRKARFQLGVADIEKTVRALGPTHLLLGKVSSVAAGAQLSLEYQLYRVDNQLIPGKNLSKVTFKAEQVPFKVAGTRLEIWKQLPILAESLCAPLGIPKPQPDEQSQLTEEEVELLGGGTGLFPGAVTPAEVDRLGEIGVREPLAALLALEYTARRDVEVDWKYRFDLALQSRNHFGDSLLITKVMNELTSEAPLNVFTWLEILDVDIKQLELYDGDSQTCRKAREFKLKFPRHNQLHLLMQRYHAEITNQMDEARVAARQAAVAAPQNPEAWINYAESVRDEAQSIRQGRIAGNISEAEWNQLGALYNQEVSLARKAVTLDPQNSRGWRALSLATTFTSDENVSTPAFWRSYQLLPSDPELLNWGMQQFQWKWGGDEKTLEKVLQIAEEPKNLPYLGFDVYRVLYGLGRKDEAAALYPQIFIQLEKECAAEPDNIQAAYRRNTFKWQMGMSLPQDYDGFPKMRPHSCFALRVLALELTKDKSTSAIPLLRQALELDPKDYLVHRDLADALMVVGQDAEAEKELIAFRKASPNDFYGLKYLATAQYKQKKYDESIETSQQLLRWSPSVSTPDMFFQLCDAQIQVKKFADAAETGKIILERYEARYKNRDAAAGSERGFNLAWAHGFYGWALAENGKSKAAQEQSSAALALDPDNAAAHFALARQAQKDGKEEEAKAELQKVWDGRDRQKFPPLGPNYFALKVSVELLRFKTP